MPRFARNMFWQSLLCDTYKVFSFTFEDEQRDLHVTGKTIRNDQL